MNISASPGRASRSQRLSTLVGALRPGLSRLMARVWETDAPGDAYRRWLAVSYAMMRATVPLLTLARDECDRLADDPVSAPLRAYLCEQVSGEAGHDTWVAGDYGLAGGDPDQLRRFDAPPAVARLIGAQYYWIRHAHPVALLGHIAVLEWNPPPRALAQELARRCALPPEAFKTIVGHADLDAEHGASLRRVLDALPLTERLDRLLTTSALASAEGLIDVTTAITPKRKGTRR
ncbi:iron-containing redox enzyme family protein [Microbispora sp. ATCC PTA-5024]|uniref:iron-containing redox enzyme family protein n=1 Tax=Microbispora sp. ATCC PTA-5024 TaxID=316330 RepID=UPI0003DCF936|nr:iron-containing redox enzyme family protein [Microbispora sp. ATCC PTA-5024]ETK37749.1 hypothetical protein MPTA5024_02115 [Microbispora sp. ATCC PTA-5024]